MHDHNLQGKRVLITQADVFMGPVLCEVFMAHGAAVVASTEPLLSADAPASIVAAAGLVDVLVVNLAIPAPATDATQVSEEEWNNVFAALVRPLPRLFQAVLPSMIERRAGKILVMGSGSALRGMKRASTYSAARGAQLAYVQAVGVEVAIHNVQVNAIAQNFGQRGQVSYFPKIVRHFLNPTHRRVMYFKGLSNVLHGVAARCAGSHDCQVALRHGCRLGKRRR